MTLLEYVKQYHNIDLFLVLVDDAGYTDDEIMVKYNVSKQRIYDARKRVEPLIKALEIIDGKKDKRDPNIQLIIDTFSEQFGTTKVALYDRYAAKRLHVKYTAVEVSKLIKVLASLSDEMYFPTVNSVSQLENKLPQVVEFVKKHSDNKIIEI